MVLVKCACGRLSWNREDRRCGSADPSDVRHGQMVSTIAAHNNAAEAIARWAARVTAEKAVS